MNQDTIEQYVAGRLGKEEAEAFEAYCVANPEFARQVEFEQRLRAGMRVVGSGSTAEFVRSNNPLHFRIAIAASFLLVASIAFFLWRNALPTSHALLAAVTEPEYEGPSMRLALVRGADRIPTLQSGFVRVEIVGLFDTNAHYSVSLDRIERHKDAETLAALYGQHPASPITLEVMIDSDRLGKGTYSLRLRRQSSDEEPLDFEFLKD
jgi:hypothetical protein